MQIKRAYRYRFYPTEGQATELTRTFGCARFVYNHFLRVRTDGWFNEQKRLNYNDTSSMLTKLKRDPEFAWLAEVSSVPVQQSLRHLQTAFGNFFARRGGYPTFHSKRGTQSASYVATGFSFDPDTRKLTLAKMDAPLDIRWSRTIPKKAKATSLTVSRDPAGRYFVSILCDDEVDQRPAAPDKKIGIDMGLNHFLITSNGEKVTAPNLYRKYEKRLARLQRQQSRKMDAAKSAAGIPKGKAIPQGTKIPKSKNWLRDQLRINRVHAKIADARRDFQHKLSTRLIRENQTISVETLTVKNMSRSAKGTEAKPGAKVKQKSGLNKSILDASWSEFIRQLEYKAAWYGREIIGIDRWYPSSKRCSSCGFILKDLSLKTRSWSCPECGTHHDRDINAARNILAAGLAVSALGEAVSPDLAYA
ncbi:MAG: RNA-guided endonuclease TnpB family protein [Geobacter sp.]|nr:RNA-guided endonuclease TnpB family protein [Geobacter sp.]